MSSINNLAVASETSDGLITEQLPIGKDMEIVVLKRNSSKILCLMFHQKNMAKFIQPLTKNGRTFNWKGQTLVP